MRLKAIWILLTICFIKSSLELNADQMFPYGPRNGDLAEYRNDDGFVQVTTLVNFPFFGTQHNQLFVSKIVYV